MFNSEKNSPKMLDMKRTYDQKFREKPAHQEADVTSWTAVAVFLLHVFSAVCAGYASQFFGLQGIEQTVVSVIWFALMVLMEYFKSTYSERYHIALIKACDENLKDDERERSYEKGKVTKNILLVFWAVSLAVVIFSAAQLALKNAPAVELLSYDSNLQSVLLQKQETLRQAQDRGVKLATLKPLQAEVSTAANDVKNDKASVDKENTSRRKSHGSGLSVYIFFGFFFGLGLEMAIFYMRQFHERKQYEIYLSLNTNESKKSAKAEQPEDNRMEVIMLEVKALKDAIKIRDANITQLMSEKQVMKEMLQPANNLQSLNVPINGSKS